MGADELGFSFVPPVHLGVLRQPFFTGALQSADELSVNLYRHWI